jgi:hypothetical protein
MADAFTVTEQIADILDAQGTEVTKETYTAIEQLLGHWEDDLVEEAKEEGKEAGIQEGYDQALKDERIVDDVTMRDLETGIDLLRRGDPCAPTYLDRALRDLGSSYY